MARPKKLPGDLKADTLSFRITPAERLQIERAAQAAGLGPTEYARMQTLKGRVTVQQRKALDHAAFDQLRRIGVNLNQLARIANQTGNIPDRLTIACELLEQFMLDELAAPHAPRSPRPPSAKSAFSDASRQPDKPAGASPKAPSAPRPPEPRHGS